MVYFSVTVNVVNGVLIMLFEVLVRQTYFGKNPLNRFHFISSGVPASVSLSFALTKALGMIQVTGDYPAGLFFDTWLSVISDELTFREVQVAALYDVEDFYVTPFPIPNTGAQTGEAVSPMTAYGIRCSRVRTDIAGGSKRFAGVTEPNVGAGGIVEPGLISGLQQLCDILSDPLTYDDEGTTLTFNSVVLGFEKYVTPKGNDAYKKYATEALQLNHVAQGGAWSPMATVRSQTSRQYD